MNEDYEIGIINKIMHGKARIMLFGSGVQVLIDIPDNLMLKLSTDMVVAVTEDHKGLVIKH